LTAYSEHADAKVVLQIADLDTTYDDEIDACIASGDALIDKLLAAHDLTVPESVPQTVEDASIYFAAWLFRRRRDPTGAEAFYAEAMEFIEVYEQDQGEPAFKVVSDQ
jgi:hypothetical protein